MLDWARSLGCAWDHEAHGDLSRLGSLWGASAQPLPDGWKKRHGIPTCGQCLASVHNIRRHILKLEDIRARDSGWTSSFMPSLEAVTSRLAHLFREARSEHDDCEVALAQLKSNQDALDCIAILSSRKAMDIPVKTKDCTYRLFQCHAGERADRGRDGRQATVAVPRESTPPKLFNSQGSGIVVRARRSFNRSEGPRHRSVRPEISDFRECGRRGKQERRLRRCVGGPFGSR